MSYRTSKTAQLPTRTFFLSSASFSTNILNVRNEDAVIHIANQMCPNEDAMPAIGESKNVSGAGYVEGQSDGYAASTGGSCVLHLVLALSQLTFPGIQFHRG